MSLRSKIVIWFLLLSVVPLAAIVSYSYFSSSRALRSAVWVETTELAAGLDEHMEATRVELGNRVRDLDRLPWNRLLASSRDGGMEGAQYREMIRELAPFVDSLEFIPSAPPPAPPALEATPVAPQPPGAAPRAPETIVEPVLIELETLLGVDPEVWAESWANAWESRGGAGGLDGARDGSPGDAGDLRGSFGDEERARAGWVEARGA